MYLTITTQRRGGNEGTLEREQMAPRGNLSPQMRQRGGGVVSNAMRSHKASVTACVVRCRRTNTSRRGGTELHRRTPVSSWRQVSISGNRLC